MKFWSKLQTRMTISYVFVTLVIVLMLEILVSALVYFALTRSPLLSAIAYYRTQQTAQTYALEASLQANETGLNQGTTFQPGHPDSLNATLNGDASVRLPTIPLEVPFHDGTSTGQPDDIFALLITPDGKVLASSDPALYPAATAAAKAVPSEVQLIGQALQGKPGSTIADIQQAHTASAAEPVWSKGNQPLGVVIRFHPLT